MIYSFKVTYPNHRPLLCHPKGGMLIYDHLSCLSQHLNAKFKHKFKIRLALHKLSNLLHPTCKEALDLIADVT